MRFFDQKWLYLLKNGKNSLYLVYFSIMCFLLGLFMRVFCIYAYMQSNLNECAVLCELFLCDFVSVFVQKSRYYSKKYEK